MKTFTTIAIATLATMSVASADKHAEKKAPADAKAPAKDAKLDPKAGEKKAEMPVPKPAAEVDALAKVVGGNWKCKGDLFDGAGGKSAITGTNKAKLDLDKFWISDVLEMKGGPATYKMAAYTTYDATAKKWRRVSVDNYGGHSVGTSDGLKDNKMVWNLDTSSPMGAGQMRESVDASDAKAGVKFSGEVSMDKGKTWMKLYDMVCKK